jgi:hypothetical protein
VISKGGYKTSLWSNPQSVCLQRIRTRKRRSTQVPHGRACLTVTHVEELGGDKQGRNLGYWPSDGLDGQSPVLRRAAGATDRRARIGSEKGHMKLAAAF